MRLTDKKTHMKRVVGAFAAFMCLIMIPTVSMAAGFATTGQVDTVGFATDLAFYA